MTVSPLPSGLRNRSLVALYTQPLRDFPSTLQKLVPRSRHTGAEHRLHTTSTTPPQTRKRKALETLESSQKTRKKANEGGVVAETLQKSALNTPPPTTMDSDDEFMSGLSSADEDFGVAQDSDDDSLGDGECHPITHAIMDD